VFVVRLLFVRELFVLYESQRLLYVQPCPHSALWLKVAGSQILPELRKAAGDNTQLGCPFVHESPPVVCIRPY
jgi:hypothetical protein